MGVPAAERKGETLVETLSDVAEAFVDQCQASYVLEPEGDIPTPRSYLEASTPLEDITFETLSRFVAAHLEVCGGQTDLLEGG